MAISIDFLANVGGFLKGTKDVDGALDDVAGSLDDLVADARKAGDRSGEQLASGVAAGGADAEGAVDGVESKLKGLSDGGGGQSAGAELAGGVRSGGSDAEGAVDSLESRLQALSDGGGGKSAGGDLASGVGSGGADAEQSVDRLEAKFRNLAAASKVQTTTVGTNISHSVQKGSEEASEGVETAKENIGANLKEVAASFDGTWQGAAGGVQGLLAEILEGFGPLGLVAGAVTAGGLGLILSSIEQGQEKTEEYKSKVGELATEWITTGKVGKRSIEDISSAITDLATATEGTKLSDVYKDAQSAGLDYKGVVAALTSGNVGEIEKERRKIGDLINDHKILGAEATTQGGVALEAYMNNRDAASRVSRVLKDQQDIARDAGKAQAAAAAAGLTEYALKKKAIEQLQNAYGDAAGEVDKYIDKESGLFDVTKYIKAMEKRADALRDYQETLSKSSLSPEAKSYIEGLGEEQAALLVDGYADATKAQKEKLNRIWSTAGRENAGSYKEALGDDLRGSTVRGPSVEAPSTSSYEAAVRAAQARAQQYLKDHPLQAGAVAYTDKGKPIF